MESSTYSGGGLKSLGPFLDDSDAIGRAVQAAQHALHSSQSAEQPHPNILAGSRSTETMVEKDDMSSNCKRPIIATAIVYITFLDDCSD